VSLAERKKNTRRQPTIYYFILTLTTALIAIGMVMIASASSVVAYLDYGDSFHFLWRQLAFGAVGVAGMLGATRVRREWLKKISPVGLFAAIASLLAVLVFGEEIGGAVRWLDIWGIPFQPSEFVKLAMVIFTADVLSRKRKDPRDIGSVMGPLGVPIALIAGLIMLQPDLGTTLIILFSVFAILYLADIKLSQLTQLAVAGFVVVAGLIAMEPYRLARVTAFRDPWADARGNGFQLVQSLLALGSGGWTGVGLGMSRQKFGYLPAPYTDFIFAVLGEELGLLGTMAVVLLYILLAFAIIAVVRRQSDAFSRYLAGGIGAMIISQAFINIGGVTSMMPLTGVPLPLISYGGTSLVLTMISIGILLNLARQKTKRKKGVDRGSTDMRRRHGRARLSRTGARGSA
jgi:cell division protein FtsW